MKISKISSLLFISITFYSINLNAMGENLSDAEFFAEKQKGFELLNQIKQYTVNHNQEVQALKKSIATQNPDALFALCLMLEEEIGSGNIKNLEILIKTRELFTNFLNENQFKNLMYYLLYYAAYHEKKYFVQEINQKYCELFEISIFEGQKESNEMLLNLLFQENKISSIKNLIDIGILKYVKNKAELQKTAHEKSLNNIESDLIKEIKEDRKEICHSIFIITICLSTLSLLPYLFS